MLTDKNKKSNNSHALQHFTEAYPTEKQGLAQVIHTLNRMFICAQFSPQVGDNDHMNMVEDYLNLHDSMVKYYQTL